MEKREYIFPALLSLIILLGLISFALCIAAEFSRSKKDDLRFEGNLCYLPKSFAFGLGITALMFLFMAQIIGNLLLIFRKLLLGGYVSRCKAEKTTVSTFFLTLSWMSFGIIVILLSVATSMSRTQEFGEGWLDGECYFVKDGVYLGSALLILVTIASIITSLIIRIRKREDEQGKKVHAHRQVDWNEN